MQIAINRNLINKASSEELRKHNSTFENTDLSCTELANFINQGFAFCPQLKGTRRSSSNFLSSGFLAVDIDHGLTLDMAKEDSHFLQYGSLLYTTPSHTETLHRFRMVFELKEPIMDKEKMRHAQTGLIAQYGSDSSCKDASRLFFGSKGSSPIVYGNRLPPHEVERLVIRGKETAVSSHIGSENGTERRNTIRSRIAISKDTVVRAANGEYGRLEDFPSQTRIYCPQHLDRHPSALTLRSKRNTPGLYCSACAATFFVENDSRAHKKELYRFDYQWDSLFHISLEEYTAHADDEGRINLSELRGWQIKDHNAQYLPYEEQLTGLVEVEAKEDDKDLSDLVEMSRQYQVGLLPQPDITLVKSPKGSGKTEWVRKLVEECKQAGKRVLMVGHRRALISATARRVGLDCYLKPFDSIKDQEETGKYHPPTDYYAICADSLTKLDPEWQKYEVVLIDEVEQVLAHLLSSTLRENRREVLHLLRHYLNVAQSIYLLDADLGQPTIDILHAMVDAPERRTVQTIVNRYSDEKRTLCLYDSPNTDHLIGELIISLRNGERCFVCSNSKKFIDSIEQEVQRKVSRPIKSIAITSDNSMKPEIQAFVRDIKSRALEYDVIFTSPALGTGIDITFDNNAPLIDTVFGFFQARINTHFDIDQQLSRVRNPKCVKVWISPEEFNFEMDIEAIKTELYMSEAEHRVFLRIKPDGTKEFHHDPLYDTVFATVTAFERASKNHLRRNFIKLRQSNGWNIETVANEKDIGALGKEVRQQGKVAFQKVEFENICKAKKLIVDEYEELKESENAGTSIATDRWALRRFEVESFFHDDVTMTLLLLDDGGRFRDQLRAYESLMSSDEKLSVWDEYYEQRMIHISDRPQHLLRKQILKALFEAAGVMRNGQFDSSLLIDTTKLAHFIDACRSRKLQLERLFGVSLRNDFDRKPINQLQIVLKIVGLRLNKKLRDQSGGQSKTYYGICESELAVLHHWATRRADTKLCDEWKSGRKAAPAMDSTIPRERVLDPLQQD